MRVIQEELVIELFLPPPQLATGGIEFLFALLGGRKENNPVRSMAKPAWETHLGSHRCARRDRARGGEGVCNGTAPGVQGLI